MYCRFITDIIFWDTSHNPFQLSSESPDFHNKQKALNPDYRASSLLFRVENTQTCDYNALGALYDTVEGYNSLKAKWTVKQKDICTQCLKMHFNVPNTATTPQNALKCTYPKHPYNVSKCLWTHPSQHINMIKML